MRIGDIFISKGGSAPTSPGASSHRPAAADGREEMMGGWVRDPNEPCSDNPSHEVGRSNEGVCRGEGERKKATERKRGARHHHGRAGSRN